MKRKVVSVLLAAVMVTSMAMVGCGKGEDAGNSGKSSSAASSGTDASSAQDGSESASSDSGQTSSGDFKLKDDLVYRIGYVNNDNSDPNTYPAALKLKDYVESEEFAKKIGADSVEVLIADSALDVEKQATNIETLLTKGVDIMFLNGVDTEGNTASVEACNAEGVPVFMVGTEATGGDWKFVGFDETEFGETQGQWCVDNLPENSKIFILEGTPGREATIKRKAGVEDIVAQRSDLEVVSSQNGDFDAATAMQVTEDWITAYGDEINCIVAADDKEANGAVEALKQNNMLDQVDVVGCICLKETADAIRNGDWKAAVLCYWASIGDLCGELAEKMYLGEEIPDRNNITLYAVDDSNIDELIEKVYG